MTILNSFDRNDNINGLGFLLILLVACIISIIVGIVKRDFYTTVFGAVTIAITIALLTITGICGAFETHNRIEAVINEDYPAVDLLREYYVIDIRGDIYVLEKRENKNG